MIRESHLRIVVVAGFTVVEDKNCHHLLRKLRKLLDLNDYNCLKWISYRSSTMLRIRVSHASCPLIFITLLSYRSLDSLWLILLTFESRCCFSWWNVFCFTNINILFHSIDLQTRTEAENHLNQAIEAQYVSCSWLSCLFALYGYIIATEQVYDPTPAISEYLNLIIDNRTIGHRLKLSNFSWYRYAIGLHIVCLSDTTLIMYLLFSLLYLSIFPPLFRVRFCWLLFPNWPQKAKPRTTGSWLDFILRI